MKKYRKKPVIVTVVQYNGNNIGEIIEFTDNNAYMEDNNLMIKTLEGKHIASVGDYIIRGIKGEFYPCKPDVFNKTYECYDE